MLKKLRLNLVLILITIPMMLGALCARIKLSAIFTSISGRYGGGVFRNWKGLTVLGVLPDSVANPNTVLQGKARALLSAASKIWSGLAVAIKDEWSEVSVYLSEQWGNYENEVGSHTVIRTPRGPYTALGALVSVCGLLGSVDDWEPGDATPDAPVGVTAPSQPTNCSVSGTTAGLVVVWDDPASWGTNGTAGFVRVWAKSEDGTFFAQFSASVAAAVTTYTITELVPAGGSGPVDLRKDMYFLQVDAVNAEGLRSAPSNVFRFEAPDPI